MVFVPTAKLVYPDGRDPEGHGVSPDLVVRLSRMELFDSVDSQVTAAVALLTMHEGDSVHRGR